MALAHGPIQGKQGKTLFSSLGPPFSLLLAIGLIVAAMLLPVVQSSDATTTGYAILHHEQELADINAQIYNTQAEVAKLDSVARIHDEAARIGMVPGPKAAIAVTVNTPPTGAILLPRRYLPQQAAAVSAPLHHSVLWNVLHALPLP
jgi:hypothetical protein